MRSAPAADTATALDTEFKRGLGLYDSTMVVAGSMIGSGIFIVSAAMARQLGSPGWLLVAWVITGVLTIAADGGYSFTPAADWNGSTSTTYTVTNANGKSKAATITIDVTRVGRASVPS